MRGTVQTPAKGAEQKTPLYRWVVYGLLVLCYFFGKFSQVGHRRYAGGTDGGLWTDGRVLREPGKHGALRVYGHAGTHRHPGGHDWPADDGDSRLPFNGGGVNDVLHGKYAAAGICQPLSDRDRDLGLLPVHVEGAGKVVSGGGVCHDHRADVFHRQYGQSSGADAAAAAGGKVHMAGDLCVFRGVVRCDGGAGVCVRPKRTGGEGVSAGGGASGTSRNGEKRKKQRLLQNLAGVLANRANWPPFLICAALRVTVTTLTGSFGTAYIRDVYALTRWKRPATPLG